MTETTPMQNELPKLWAHQEEAIKRAGDYFALFFDPGTGKTATTINILRKIFAQNKRILPTLVLCPPVVVSNWKNEILKYSKIKSDRILPLVGTGKERLALLQKATSNTICITNYETLNMPEVLEELKRFLGKFPELKEPPGNPLKGEKYKVLPILDMQSKEYKARHTNPWYKKAEGKVAEWDGTNWKLHDPISSCLILDESHKCKDITSKRTKRAIELSDIASYRYILTGTPILNNLMDIFSQFRILDRGERFGHNFFSFRARFFEDKNRAMPASKYFPRWEPIKNADLKIKELIAPVSMHIEKSKCLTLPPLVRKIIEVPMSKEQERLYESMRKDLIATVQTEGSGDRHSIAELAITKALRLQQIVSGHVRVEGLNGDDDATIQIKENPRKDALKQLLEDLAPNHKTIVWAVFKANYDDIRSVCTSLGLEYAELHGEISNRDEQINRFTNDEKCRVLIGHPGSGGIGVNLVAASYSIFYSRSFSLEFDLQAEARNYRGGSERHESITRIDIVAKNTIDEIVLKALESKQALSQSVLKEKINEI